MAPRTHATAATRSQLLNYRGEGDVRTLCGLLLDIDSREGVTVPATTSEPTCTRCKAKLAQPRNSNATAFKLKAGWLLYAVLETEEAQVVGLILAPDMETARELYLDDIQDAVEREMVDGWFEEGLFTVQSMLNRVVAPRNASISLTHTKRSR